MIVIVDYGLGNLGSVKKAINRVGYGCLVSNNPDEIKSADKLILPGVGNFKVGIENLKSKNLVKILEEEVLEKKKPILGICLGMQLMTSSSEEGLCEGLNWVGGFTQRFPDSDNLKIPHMGWNTLRFENHHTIYNEISEQDFFYFVHSYYVTGVEPKYKISETEYGLGFVSSFAKENIIGCQFHPEKSHDAGLKLLRNFCAAQDFKGMKNVHT